MQPPPIRRSPQRREDDRAADDRQDHAEHASLDLVGHPVPRRLVGQPVAMLEHVALVKRKRQFEEMQQKSEGDREARRRCPTSSNPGGRKLPTIDAYSRSISDAVGEQEREQDDARGQRCRRVGAPAETVIAAGFVFVHGRFRCQVSGSGYHLIRDA